MNGRIVFVDDQGQSQQLQMGHRVLIIGAARQGLALAGYLACHGVSVVINDLRSETDLAAAKMTWLENAGHHNLPILVKVEWVTGGHPLELLEEIDLVYVSGGVPLTNPLVSEAVRLGIPLSNDSQLFMELVPCKVIGITGSAGKTTTTTLVGRIAQASGLFTKVWVGGNIGLPLIAFVDEISPDDLVVMELSSFQLELMSRSPDLAVVLNVTPNHLDRHGSMDTYLAAKGRILDFQTSAGVAVLGRDDPGAVSLHGHVQGRLLTFGMTEPFDRQEGAFYRAGGLFLRLKDQADVEVLQRSDIRLRGEHNVLNVLAACTICSAVGISPEAMKAGIVDFGGVSHRLEFVRTWGGADWYNDSIATAPERAMAAIRSFDEPLIVLAGGRDKNLPWEDFARLAYQRVDHLVLFGEAAVKILKVFSQIAEELENQVTGSARGQKTTIHSCANLKAAVQQAASLVQSGDVVLLSPGGTSFDEFHDFEERGECFTQWVKELP